VKRNAKEFFFVVINVNKVVLKTALDVKRNVKHIALIINAQRNVLRFAINALSLVRTNANINNAQKSAMKDVI
jgi:hypothetical protein